MKGWKSMSTDYNPHDLVSQLIMSHNPQSALNVSPILIRILGADSAVLFALLLEYWHRNNRTWFAKPAKEWMAELGMSEEIVKRILKGNRRAPYKISLADFGVDIKVKQHNGTPTMHYNINWDRIREFLSDYEHVIDDVLKTEIRKKYGKEAVDQIWRQS